MEEDETRSRGALQQVGFFFLRHLYLVQVDFCVCGRRERLSLWIEIREIETVCVSNKSDESGSSGNSTQRNPQLEEWNSDQNSPFEKSKPLI